MATRRKAAVLEERWQSTEAGAGAGLKQALLLPIGVIREKRAWKRPRGWVDPNRDCALFLSASRGHGSGEIGAERSEDGGEEDAAVRTLLATSIIGVVEMSLVVCDHAVPWWRGDELHKDVKPVDV